MKKIVFSLISFWCIGFVSIYGQSKKKSYTLKQPKIVIGIMIDQMRWDYLYRYQNRYTANGFNTFLKDGFNCQNTFIPYTPTATACGHACVYTGSVPAINGITGNNWWDEKLNKSVTSVEDKTVKTVGSTTNEGQQSPHYLKTSTIGDQLQLATNFKAKTIGISIKPRASILPAGHIANAAYWYDEKVGKFITSTFYMQQLPAWVEAFNNRNLPDFYYKQGWNLLYPLNTYTNSTNDTADWERIEWMGVERAVFPYNLEKYMGKDYKKLPYIPQGNDYTLEMAKAAIEGENLGNNMVTDFLALSLSSTDYMGHSFGPNSVEAEDMFLRLDKSLANFFSYLDKRFGKGNYTTFLTADHGVAHVANFAKSKRLPAGSYNSNDLLKEGNKVCLEKFGVDKIIFHQTYYNLSIDIKKIDSAKLNLDEVKQTIISALQKMDGIYRVIDKEKIQTSNLPNPIRERIINGYFPGRSGQLQVIPMPQWFKDNPKGTDHSVWNPYDAHIPLLWYGWGINKGESFKEMYMTDIAPTLAALLKIEMPNGCVGKVIEEVIKK
jgi:hypothetical protein